MSLTLNERFSRIAPAPRVQQTVQVNLGNVRPQRQQQLSSGRTIVGKKQQGQQPQGRLNVKQKVGLSASTARTARRAVTQDRVVSGRERAVATRRAAAPKPQQQQQFVQVPVVPLTPFQLAPQFTQLPAFNIGSSTRQGQQQPQKKGTQKKAAGGKAPAAGARQSGARQAGRGAKAAPATGRQAKANGAANGTGKKKAAGKPAAGRGGKAAAAAPASKEKLDADMDSYMSAAPQ